MKLYNSMTRTKEEFVPITEGEVKMYSCGPTVYNYFHIGNARPFIIFDVLRRYLEYKGYKVTFVQNFTDVDDKLINKAAEEGITVPEIAEKYIEEYFKDAKGLDIHEASCHPRATENIDAIIELIKTLIENDYAYEVSGDVYFSTKKFKEYGKLSHQPLEELEVGARIEVDDRKKDPMDFALWKNQKGSEIAWESPWGLGRPGWHIECSAMATKYLGKTIDIHSGGRDLIFPHHENEIAQSEAAHNANFANYWLHNGYININNEKMSKSKGNFFTVRDIAEKYDYEVIRFFMLSAHYRSPINFSDELMGQAKAGLDRLYGCKERLEEIKGQAGELPTEVSQLKEKFIEAMDDDVNTADAISVLFEMVRLINSYIDNNKDASQLVACLNTLTELSGVLGLLKGRKVEDIDDSVKALIEERQKARAEKNFKRSDEIRDILKEMGITLEDTREGVKWRRDL